MLRLVSVLFFFFSSRRRHTRLQGDWSSDVCSSDLPGPFLVSLAGQSIPYFTLSTGPNYTLYGADVSAFSGQTVELRFSAVGGVVGGNNWNLDNISFSNLPVPEPGVFG